MHHILEKNPKNSTFYIVKSIKKYIYNKKYKYLNRGWDTAKTRQDITIFMLYILTMLKPLKLKILIHKFLNYLWERFTVLTMTIQYNLI
jgi:hypothetical protein